MNYLPIHKPPNEYSAKHINQSLLLDSDFSLRQGAYAYLMWPIYYPYTDIPTRSSCTLNLHKEMNNLFQIILVQNSTVYLTDKRTRFPKIYYTDYPNNIPNIKYEDFVITALHFIEKLNGIASTNMQNTAMKNMISVNKQ